MNKLLRLIALVGMLAFGANAHAYFQASFQNGGAPSGFIYSSAAAACAATGAGSEAYDTNFNKYSGTPTTNLGGYCYTTQAQTGGWQYQVPSCPAGSTATATGCACPTGQNFDVPTNQCKTPAPTCATGDKKESAIYQGMKSGDGIEGGNYSFPTSIDGCMIRVTSLKGCVSQPDGKVFCTYRYTVNQPAPTGTNGVVSAGAPTGPLKEEIATGAAAGNGEGCPVGTVSIGVSGSGMVQCAGSGTNPPSAGASQPVTVKPPITTTDASGATVTKQDTVTTNKDGSTTTTTSQVTSLSDGTKTTSTSQVTGNATDGTSGVADAKTGQDPNKSDLCALHPELNLCKNSTFSGTCGEVSCTGDAIQCGILRAAAQKACIDASDKTALEGKSYTGTGNSMLAGAAEPGLPSKTNAATWGIPTSLNNQGWLGGGSCFPDKQFNVRGYSFTLSFTKACDPLIAFRYALMIIALLASFKMLGGAILKD